MDKDIKKTILRVIGKDMPDGIIGKEAEAKEKPEATPTKKVLKKDIVIPAGTVFELAPKNIALPAQHHSHLIGLTPDSCGELIYYIDPDDDPATEEWFTDDPANISVMPGITKMDITPERILEAAKGQLKDVLVLGIEKQTPKQEKDGQPGNFYFCSSSPNKERALWIIQNFNNQLLNGFRDLWLDKEEDDE